MTFKVKELNDEIMRYKGFVKQIKNDERGGRYEMIHTEDNGKRYELDVCFFQIGNTDTEE